jgi:hypothetical protein
MLLQWPTEFDLTGCSWFTSAQAQAPVGFLCHRLLNYIIYMAPRWMRRGRSDGGEEANP